MPPDALSTNKSDIHHGSAGVIHFMCCLVAFCFLLASVPAAADEYDQSAPYWYANPADVAAWRQLKFGLFVHWGPAAVSGKDISWARQGRGRFGPGEIPNEVYDNLYKQFNPVKYDPRDWVRVAQSAGMKYLVFTSKHHDGFCNFDTQQGDYKITSPASPYGKDVVRPLADACHAAGLKFGLYYSQVDWHHPDFKTKNHARYLKYYQGQIRELLSNYGRVDMLWFDNLGHGGQFGGDARDSAADEVFQLARGLQPHLLINDRCGVPGDFATPEQRVGKYNFTEPWESCFKLAGQYWSWEADAKVLPLKQCVDLLVRCVAGDGNLLLNVG
ncbi:MAG: alpha-L-fucosidase, partial [Planctomycetia bacterium]|nr:alpha-L-fucosidase [Planctomycetia bacterium]